MSETPKRRVWILLAVTSLMALLAVLSGDDFVRLLANGVFVLSAIGSAIYFVRIHRVGFSLVVLAIFAVVIMVAGRQTKVPPGPELIPPVAPVAVTKTAPVLPVPEEPPSKAVAEQTDTYLESLQVPLIPYSETAETRTTTTAPVVIQKGGSTVARQFFYLDEATATYHAEGCPEITPRMTRGVKSAATLRGLQPHTCVK